MTKSFRLAIFTICSNNYIPVARTFLESAWRYHPEADFFICLVDRILAIPELYDLPAQVIEAERLSIPDFRSFSFRYDVMELNTAVKPFMFRYLFEELEYDVVIYFDPDIQLFRPVEQVVTSLRCGASFVLTPHLCAPSENAEEPNDFTIMRAGIYNLGFLGAARCEESTRLIDWWARRLRFQCINAQHAGIFVDQKFMDLLPAFAPMARISHDTTLNVAYWNLRQRRLEQNDRGWVVDGKPLSFFHYSGYDPRKPANLSKHDSSFDNAMPEPLQRLTREYAGRLISNGYGTIPDALYAYGKFQSGTLIHPFVRKMFREWHRFWPDDPYLTYEAFLEEPWSGATRERTACVVTNFMKFLHGEFAHLYARLNLQDPTHVQELVDWYIMRAHSELRLDLPLVISTAARRGAHHPSLPHRSRLPNSCNGADVTVVGYLRTASGMGEEARQIVLALDAAGFLVEAHDVALNVAGVRNDERCSHWLRKTGTASAQIFKINADQLPEVLQHTRNALVEGAVRIGIPSWELSQFPSAWLPAFVGMDEVWAPSRFIQISLAGRIDKPVIHIPVPLELTPPPPLPRARFGLPEDRFLFFYAFDFLSFIRRKNPSAAVAAFREAFPQRGRVGLVIKSMNGALAPKEFIALRDEIDGDQDIYLIDAALSRDETLGLLAASNCTVALHRSEGVGLLALESMLLQRPVIATGYSATQEFVTNSRGYPVGYELVPVKEGEYPFPEGQVWADPDVSHAAWLMRRLQYDPDSAAGRIADACRYLRQCHSHVAVGRLMAERLRLLVPPLQKA